MGAFGLVDGSAGCALLMGAAGFVAALSGVEGFGATWTTLDRSGFGAGSQCVKAQPIAAKPATNAISMAIIIARNGRERGGVR